MTIATPAPLSPKLVERLQLSLSLAESLEIEDAAAALRNLRTHAGADSVTVNVPTALVGQIAMVLSRAEPLLRPDRAHWAALMREELALIGAKPS